MPEPEQPDSRTGHLAKTQEARSCTCIRFFFVRKCRSKSNFRGPTIADSSDFLRPTSTYRRRSRSRCLSCSCAWWRCKRSGGIRYCRERVPPTRDLSRGSIDFLPWPTLMLFAKSASEMAAARAAAIVSTKSSAVLAVTK